MWHAGESRPLLARDACARSRVGCVNSIAWANTADLQAEPTLRTPHPPDPLQHLRAAWTVALNDAALRLLRYANDYGSLARADALGISETDITRSSAEDLADRLDRAGLLDRVQDRPVKYVPSPLGQAVLRFIDDNLDARLPSTRSTILILDDTERAELEDAGFELFSDLRRTAIDVASLRPQS